MILLALVKCLRLIHLYNSMHTNASCFRQRCQMPSHCSIPVGASSACCAAQWICNSGRKQHPLHACSLIDAHVHQVVCHSLLRRVLASPVLQLTESACASTQCNAKFTSKPIRRLHAMQPRDIPKSTPRGHLSQQNQLHLSPVHGSIRRAKMLLK